MVGNPIPSWVPGIGGEDTPDTPPISFGLPAALSGLENKYTDQAPDSFLDQITNIQGLSPATLRTLQRLDAQRVSRGQRPYTTQQSLGGLRAATTGQANTPAPRKGFFDRGINDLRSLVGSIPQLLNPNPHRNPLVQEVAALQHAPEAINKGVQDQSLSEILRAPGIRLIPGTYTAANLISGGPGAALEHPLFTALDVLPAAEKLAGPLSEAARGSELGGRLAESSRPVRQAIRSSKPGQIAAEMFGLRPTIEATHDLGDLAEVQNKLNRKINQLADNTNPNIPVDHDVALLERRSQELSNKYDIPQDRRELLGAALERDIPTARSLAQSDVERAWVDDVVDLTNDYEAHAVRVGGLVRDEVLGEVFNPDRFAEIKRARQAEAEYNHGYALQEYVKNPTPAFDFNPYLERVATSESKAGLLRSSRALSHAMEVGGYDTRAIRKLIVKYEVTSGLDAAKGAATLSGEFAQALANGGSLTNLDLPSIAQRIPYRPNDALTVRFHEQISAGNWSRAAKTLRTIERRTGPGAIDTIDADLRGTVARNVRRDNYLEFIRDPEGRPFSPRGATQASTARASAEANTAPSRFDPAIGDATRRKFADYLRARSAAETMGPNGDLINPNTLAQALGDLDRGAYANIPGWEKELTLDDGTVISPAVDEYRRLGADVKKTWKLLKEQGDDPLFLHRIPSTGVAQIHAPRVLERVLTPTQFRERLNDITPYVKDPNITLSHQGMELLRREGSEEFVHEIYRMFGKDRAELERSYTRTAESLTRRNGRDFRTNLDELLKKDYRQLDSTGVLPWRSTNLGSLDYSQQWIPKAVAKTIEDLHSATTGKLATVVDPVLKVFRTSLLAASPRWHAYNILGGGMMLAARTDPTIFLTQLRNAYRMVKEGTVSDELARDIGLHTGMGTVGAEVVDWNKASTFLHNYKAGVTMRNWMDAGGKLIQKSYDFNQMVDDMYRSMAYLYGHDKGITKGLSEEASRAAGISLSKKILQDWDRMTPMARNTMRYIFPFYGWIQHLMKYSFTYPFDHPIRTAVMGTFARREMEDYGTGLPQRLMDALFLGPADDNGMVHTIQTAGMNPFSDVANYASTIGFMFGGETHFTQLVSDINPLFGAGLQAIGIDPITGTSGLYPDVQYDPESGRLVPRTGNFLSILGGNIVPQARILEGMFDSHSDFQDLLRTNPQAAGRQLMSQLGLPVLYRDINPQEEIIKAEVARDQGFRDTLNEALNTGRWDAAIARYPSLQNVLGVIRQLQESGQLSPYQTAQSGATSLSALQQAIVGGNTPG